MFNLRRKQMRQRSFFRVVKMELVGIDAGQAMIASTSGRIFRNDTEAIARLVVHAFCGDLEVMGLFARTQVVEIGIGQDGAGIDFFPCVAGAAGTATCRLS